MRNRSIGAVLVVFLLTLALSCSALAEPGSVTYRKLYDLDGIIMIKSQVGSEYNDSGQHKTLIQGAGKMTRSELIEMSKAGLDLGNKSFWVADPGSLRGLELASTFELHNLGEDELLGSADGKQQSKQIFAVSIKADPGEEGSLEQDISAASAVYDNDEGDFFAIDQSASTSGGTVKRHIDITEPSSGEYLFEDAVIKGRVDISESLRSSAGQSESVNIANSGSFEAGASEDEEALVIDGSEIFKSTVPLGTAVEEIGLHEELAFTIDNIIVNDIYVNWTDHFFAEYNPDQPGDYTFEGELVFPDLIMIDYKVYIFHVVTVEEQ